MGRRFAGTVPYSVSPFFPLSLLLSLQVNSLHYAARFLASGMPAVALGPPLNDGVTSRAGIGRKGADATSMAGDKGRGGKHRESKANMRQSQKGAKMLLEGGKAKKREMAMAL